MLQNSIKFISFFNLKFRKKSFVGQSYILCKVLRKISKGQNIKLDAIFDSIKKMPLSAENNDAKCLII